MFCQKFQSNYKRLFKKFDAAIEKFLPQITLVVGLLKTAVDSGFARDFVDLTPNTWDNNLRDRFSAVLTKALLEFQFINESLNPNGTVNVPAMIFRLSKLMKADRDSFYIKLSGLLLKYLHEKRLSQSEYDSFVQVNYTLNKTN